MGTVTIHFIGLFLFTNAKEGGGKRVAVIDTGLAGVLHGGKELSKHFAYFTATGVRDRETVDWPRDGNQFELAGKIGFEPKGTLSAPDDRWTLPHLVSGCPSLKILDSFFDVPKAGATHATIAIEIGELCSWRIKAVPSLRGAVNTQLTIKDPTHFAITRDDGKRIDFNPAENPVIMFWNTEEHATDDDSDWYWYYVAAGSECRPDPDDTGIVAPCHQPEDMNPLSLGCSNSNYP